ncbi:DUF4190 domain-containing protein [Actinopolyspora saharensis]|uniref:DUF4190 domain-containing protein n=1 Tax=Actinopolyspora saharensis TaxID=995062 RepID=UPI003F67D4EF
MTEPQAPQPPQPQQPQQPQPQQPPQPPQPPQRLKPKFSGMAWASLILGIIGMCGSPIPILNNLTAVAAFVGVILGVIALFGGKKIVASIGTGLGVLAIVITVILQGMMVRELDKALEQGGSGSGTSSTDSATPGSGSGSGSGSDSGSNSTVRLDFGQEHSWSGGETISISQPTAYESDNQFLQPTEGNRYIQFDVRVTNNGDDEYNVGSSSITVQHNGQVAQQNYAAGDQFPNTQLPPGDSVTYTMVFEISQQTGKLQVSVEPNVFATDTVYFSGQV